MTSQSNLHPSVPAVEQTETGREWQRREFLLPRAKRLREIGLSYPAIAKVMGEDHGLYYDAATWRHHLVNRYGVSVDPRKRRSPGMRGVPDRA